MFESMQSGILAPEPVGQHQGNFEILGLHHIR